MGTVAKSYEEFDPKTRADASFGIMVKCDRLNDKQKAEKKKIN
jgi:2-hydroxy-3-keto-5-methylthiopentenyl-1-phosphate phosphatase